MASQEEEAAQAANVGADLEKPLAGEDPGSDSLAEVERWVAVYQQLVELEQHLFDTLAFHIPKMQDSARREAEATNLPVLLTQLERFRHRLAYWQRRRDELEAQR